MLVIWSLLIATLLMMGGFIRVGTWGNFNCGFGMWNGGVSFDGMKLLIVFIVFEMEVIVVVMVLSYVILLVLMLVTVVELLLLYL